jgi:outer membrane protein assembly factor BamE
VNRTFAAAFRLPLLAALALVLAGCNTWQTYLPDIKQLGVYKIDINQGNYITQDMVEKLKVGQTKQQVRTVLGTPLLSDPFHADRWDYVYQFQRNRKVVESRQFTVYFASDKLARWEGDEAPVSAAQLNRIAGERAMPPEPSADDQGYLGKIWDVLKGNW